MANVRVLIATHGTRGDVQPTIALGLELRARGHEVRFLAPANFTGWIASFGFRCDSDGIDVERELRDPAVNIHSFRSQIAYFRDVVPKLFDTPLDASRDVDLIVGAGVQFGALSIAERRGVPYASAAFCPCVVPGSVPPAIRRQALPPWANRLIWRAVLPGMDLLVRGPMNRGRARLGLPPLARPMSALLQRPILIASDVDLGPLAPDAPSTAVQTGAWILNDPTPLDRTVAAFLDAGPPPVYIGFGSMVAKRVDRLAASVAAVARARPCRLIVSGGWVQLERHLPPSDDVLIVDQPPHQALFPRVAAVVHHGGAGTTLAAARAGVPQVILPHLLDQYYWAHRIETLGLGPASVHVERITPDALLSRVRAAIGDPSYRTRASAIATRIAACNGVAAAADYLERHVARRRAS